MTKMQAGVVSISRKIADRIIGQCNEKGEHVLVETLGFVPGMLLMAMMRAGIQFNEPATV